MKITFWWHYSAKKQVGAFLILLMFHCTKTNIVILAEKSLVKHMRYKTCLMQWLIHFVIPLFLSRVMDQHKMSKEEWEQSITTWWNEHKAMLRFVLILRLFSVGDVNTLMLSVYQLCKGNNVRHDWKNSGLVAKCDCFNYRTHLQNRVGASGCASE
jgi:hypothetical protein